MSAKPKLVLKKLKSMGTIWHPDSTLVFKSQQDRKVIGRLVDTTFINLDDECIILAEQWEFKIDESLLADESSEKDSTHEDNDDEEDNEEQTDVEKHATVDLKEHDLEDSELKDELKEPELKDEPKEPELKDEPKEPELKDEGKSVVNHNVDTQELVNRIRSSSNELSCIIDKKDVEIMELNQKYNILEKECEGYRQKFSAMKSMFN